MSLRRGCVQERLVMEVASPEYTLSPTSLFQERLVMEVAGVGDGTPLIIPVDLGGGDWLEPVTGAAGMGWSGSCRMGSGAGSLEFGV